MMTAERVAAAAAAWNFARVRALELKTERDGYLCELAEAADPSGHLHEDQKRTEPCWKSWEDGFGDEDRTRLEESEWCESCRRRERVHLTITAANKRRGAALRVLMRYAAQYPVDMRMTRELQPAAYQRAMAARTM